MRWIRDHKYGNRYDGLDGNDDAGTLCAWYVFSALGFYPLAGSDRYQLGAPLSERTERSLKNKSRVIVAENYTPGHFYVREVLLNDTLLDRSWLRHSEIEDGGMLRFVMDSELARHWEGPPLG